MADGTHRWTISTPIPGGWRASIDEVGTYLRDSYDFNGDQPLGSWGPDGLSRMAILAPQIEVDPRRAGTSRRGGQAYRTVGNDSFRRFRALTARGGDKPTRGETVQTREALFVSRGGT